jgi:hypothetical protein
LNATRQRDCSENRRRAGVVARRTDRKRAGCPKRIWRNPWVIAGGSPQGSVRCTGDVGLPSWLRCSRLSARPAQAPLAASWKARFNTRRARSERTRSRPRRPELCHSRSRRGALKWVSVGRASRPARSDFISFHRCVSAGPDYRLRPLGAEISRSPEPLVDRRSVAISIITRLPYLYCTLPQYTTLWR